MSEVRGGRQAATTKAEEAKAQEAAKLAHERLLNDIRRLLTTPEFVRVTRHLIAESGAFARPRLFTAEANWLGGRAELGLYLWNLIVAADPDKVLDLLDLTASTPKDTE